MLSSSEAPSLAHTELDAIVFRDSPQQLYLPHMVWTVLGRDDPTLHMSMDARLACVLAPVPMKIGPPMSSSKARQVVGILMPV